MPGPAVTATTTVQCAHMGRGTPTTPNPRVSIQGQPVVTIASPYAIAGCPFTTPSGTPLPCVTAQFTTAATRVQAGGQPILLSDSQATTIPNGVPVIIVPAQTRVVAQ
ncbi:MAG TPA: hypothetical protein VEK11_15810 [Thermoanaerobaculia bacterium]|jgi:hypothetical protein|nr:hypothetical protein [Thermoanaerobaculia bacterium]